MSSIPGNYARPFSAPVARPPTPAARPSIPTAPQSGSGWQPTGATSVPGRRPAARAESGFTPAANAPPAATPSTLRMEVFDGDKNWKPFFTGSSYGDPKATDAPFAQRVSQRMFVTADGQIFTETKAVVKAPAETILAQLRDPSFWNNGSVDHWAAKPNGDFTYALWPAGKMAGLKVNETMHAPERQKDGSYIVRIDLSRKGDGSQLMPGQAEGQAYMLIKPRPDGSCEVSGRFAGVRESAPLFSAENFAKNHLLAERGELKGNAAGVAFINQLMPNGTGFGAMFQRAEKLTR